MTLVNESFKKIFENFFGFLDQTQEKMDSPPSSANNKPRKSLESVIQKLQTRESESDSSPPSESAASPGNSPNFLNESQPEISPKSAIFPDVPASCLIAPCSNEFNGRHEILHDFLPSMVPPQLDFSLLHQEALRIHFANLQRYFAGQSLPPASAFPHLIPAPAPPAQNSQAVAQNIATMLNQHRPPKPQKPPAPQKHHIALQYGATMGPNRMSYPREFKLMVVKYYYENGQNKYRTCKNFQITKSMLNGWLAKASQIEESRPGSLKSGKQNPAESDQL